MAKAYNKEEWMERAKLQREEATNIVKKQIESYQKNPEKIAEAFRFGQQFYQYSYRNVTLIYGQNPNATYVQSFNEWKKMDARINKGAKGLKVLVPMEVTYIAANDHSFVVKKTEAKPEHLEAVKNGTAGIRKKTHYGIGNVFDISQTNFPKERYPELFYMGYKDEALAAVLEGMKVFANEKLGCPVEVVDMKSISLRGSYHRDLHRIELNGLLEDSQALSTMIHEIGHAMLHRSRDGKSTAQVEFEADAISTMIEASCGIAQTDTRTEHMVNHYKKLEIELENSGVQVDEKLGEVFENVFRTYKENIEAMQNHIEAKVEELNLKEPFKEVMEKGEDRLLEKCL